MVKIFDSHVHLGLSKFVGIPSAEESRLPIYGNAVENKLTPFIRDMVKNRIFKCIVIPFPFPNISVRKANEYVLKAANMRPDLFLPSLLISDDISFIESQKNNIIGLKEEFYLTGARQQDKYFPAYEFLQNNNLFLLNHTY